MNSRVVPGWQAEEWKQVFTRRRKAFAPIESSEDRGKATEASAGKEIEPDDLTKPQNLVGLSVSGGGIRSALYNDGFLQGLSHRGFLRYVDYLSSVSGGGYIAGHLISQAKNNQGGQSDGCFHDDVKRRSLGRDPKTGKVDKRRLLGIGGYLSRPFEFLPAYLWSFFFSFAFYIGALGILATLAALFWRSFDDPLFRHMYFAVLGLSAGEELTVAFIPAILVILLAVICEAGIMIYRGIVGMEEEGPRRFHLLSRKVYLLLIVFALLTSVAVFLGNGITNPRANPQGALRLNYFAQYFAIAAGVIQIFVFLGRDRLFRSERGESKQWQKYVQQGVTTSALLFLTFSMVHWMGRENISDYANHRDPHLVRGDVSDWYVIDQVFTSYEVMEAKLEPEQLLWKRIALFLSDEESTSLDPSDLEMPKIKPASNWLSHLASRRLGLGKPDRLREEDLPQPPSPLAEVNTEELGKIWTLPNRLWGACIAYRLAMLDDVRAKPRESTQTASINGTADTTDSIHARVESIFVDTAHLRERQSEQLKQWNEYLQEPEFTAFLLDGIAKSDDPTNLSDEFSVFAIAGRVIGSIVIDSLTPEGFSLLFPIDTPVQVRPESFNPPQGYISVSERVSEALKSTEVEMAESQRNSLLKATRRLRLIDPPSETSALNSEKLKTATANRLLLEGLFPGVVRRIEEPSTHVVPPHDQQARRRWLCFWMVLMLIGMIGGLGPTRVATVFQFYREQLAANFLVAADGDNKRFGEKQLYELDPTSDGLPYPLMLAATLAPSTQNGSYHVDARPFVFSPLYCGSFEDDGALIRSKQVSFSKNSARPAVNLGDAVTLSGAAVTPLMTGNRWLSMILDFFNTGIGQRLQRVDRTGEAYVRRSRLPYVYSFIACAIVLYVAYSIIELTWPWVCLAVGLTALLSHCLINRIGSPGLIRSLVLPHVTEGYRQRPMPRRDETPETDDEDEVECPRSFYVADGGYADYLGVSELLRRRCDLIIVSDAGANIGNNPLGTLAHMCEKASREMGIKFLDLDHEAPIEFGRLQINDQRLVHQPYLCMRIRYPEEDGQEHDSDPNYRDGHMFYCQMSITDTDPIEIQNIRNLFPSFPDEPTVNQFYSDKQVTAYRTLGYHIANRLCNELETWQSREGIDGKKEDRQQPEAERTGDEHAADTRDARELRRRELQTWQQQRPRTKPRTVKWDYESSLMEGRLRVLGDEVSQPSEQPFDQQRGQQPAQLAARPPWHQPLFPVLEQRLLTAYRLACYEELTYREDDIFSEAIWQADSFAFPTFRDSATRIMRENCIDDELPDRWLQAYERSADVRSAYRTAVIQDINELSLETDCLCESLWSVIAEIARQHDAARNKYLLASHLTNIGTACQEVHRGRPHATFQVGGRRKLIHLCRSISECVLNAKEHPSSGEPDENLRENMDGVVAELVELERSVFQGGEHVATISFAQCTSTMWGRFARTIDRHPSTAAVKRMVNVFMGEPDLTASLSDTTNRKSAVIQATELRRQLDVGLRRLRLEIVRDALMKSWYLGYFDADEITDPIKQEADRRLALAKKREKTRTGSQRSSKRKPKRVPAPKTPK